MIYLSVNTDLFTRNIHCFPDLPALKQPHLSSIHNLVFPFFSYYDAYKTPASLFLSTVILYLPFSDTFSAVPRGTNFPQIHISFIIAKSPDTSIHGAKPTATRKHRGIDPRDSHQMNMQACPLGSLPAGIKHHLTVLEFSTARNNLLFISSNSL